jgi:hypothetical protein
MVAAAVVVDVVLNATQRVVAKPKKCRL